MFKLDRHIEILLMSHDCVIVPGFGGFVVHHVPSRIDADDNVMLPPLLTVGFNPQLTLNDSLLAQSYVDAYDISYPEALREIDDEVGQLREMIAEYGFFEIHSVGKIILNGNGFYEFEPFDAGILAPSLYGLSYVDLNDSEAFITDNKSVSEVATLQPDVEEDTDNDKTISISVRAIKRFAVACSLLLLIAAVPFVQHNPDTQQILSGLDLGFFSKLTPKSETKADMEVAPRQKVTVYVQKKTEKPVATVEHEAEPLKEVADAEELQTKALAEQQTVNAPKYTVVLAARITEKNAEEYTKSLHKRGLTLAHIIGEGKARKVVFGTFDTEEEAQQTKRNMASNPEFASVWVYEIN